MPNKLIRANDGTLLGNSFFAVGSVQQTFLSSTEFESIMGTDWVLADGRAVTGSLYESITGNSNVPDCRGRFLRMVGGNANPTIGGTQDNAFESHFHNLSYDTTNTPPDSGTSFGANGGLRLATNLSQTATAVISSSGAASETRPDNITVNTFIKIN